MLEKNTRRKIDARIMSIMLTLVMCFSVFAIMPENSYAASVSKVKGLKVKSVGCDALQVSWSTAKGAKKYKVYLSTKSKSGFDCVATTTSKSITGSDLKTGTKYYIKVRGVTTYNQKEYYHSKKKKWVTSKPSKKYIKDTRTVTKEKYGSYSSTVSAKTGSHSFFKEEVYATPTTDGYTHEVCMKCGLHKNKKITEKATGIFDLYVENLKAKPSTDFITLSWDKNPDAETYKVYRNGTLIKTLSETTITDSDGLEFGVNYTYKVTACAKDQESEATEIKTALTTPFKVHENLTLSYGDANIYIGQDWSKDIETKLAVGSSADVITIERPGYRRGDDEKVYDETVYLYDTGDYDNFLMVYVSGGQIIKWLTDGTTFGTLDGKAFNRGDVINASESKSWYKVGKFICMTNSSELKECTTPSKDVWNKEVPNKGVLIGGFQEENIDSYIGNKSRFAWEKNMSMTDKYKDSEKVIGFHCINAYRYLMGLKPAVYNEYLDGHNNTTTITFKGTLYENIRYGAQAVAETNAMGIYYEGKKLSHDMTSFTVGPLAGIDKTIQGRAVNFASRFSTGSAGNEILAQDTILSGESVMFSFNVSYKHLKILLSTDPRTSIGIGIGQASNDSLIVYCAKENNLCEPGTHEEFYHEYE